MPASYPTNIKTYTVKVDGAGNIVFAAHVNELQDEVTAVETGLISGVQHALRPDSSANNRDLGLTSARWRDLLVKGTIDIDQGIITTSDPAWRSVATWNAPGITFVHSDVNITDTASAVGSLLVKYRLDGADRLTLRKDGLLTVTGALNLLGTTNQIVLDADAANTLTITMAALTAARTWTLPDLTSTFVGTTGVQTLSDKIIVSPALSGTVVGTYTLGGTVSISAPTLTGSVPQFTLAADPIAALQAATKQYVDALGSGADSPFRIIRGRIDTTGSGTILQGVGFTIVRNAVGDVTVTFTTAFGGVPTCVGTSEGAGSTRSHVRIDAVPTTTTARFQVIGLANPGTADETHADDDGIFHFIAIGPR